MCLFGLLILNLFLFLLKLSSICLVNNLFLQLESMLFQEFLSFMLKFFFKLSDFLLFANSRLKLCLFSSSLFLKHSFLLHLLLDSCLF